MPPPQLPRARRAAGQLPIRLGAKLGIERFRQRGIASYRAFVGGDRVGSAGPPSDEVKRSRLLQLFQSSGHTTLVESGTFLGDTVAFFLPYADRIVSVEIDPDLHRAATHRFAPYPNVDIVLGDALEHIPALLPTISASCLVWLDGHFSKGITGQGRHIEPAAHLLEALSDLPLRRDLTVVVDDLRLFGLHAHFPTLDSLVASARRAFPDARIWAETDGLVIQQADWRGSDR